MNSIATALIIPETETTLRPTGRLVALDFFL